MAKIGENKYTYSGITWTDYVTVASIWLVVISVTPRTCQTFVLTETNLTITFWKWPIASFFTEIVIQSNKTKASQLV